MSFASGDQRDLDGRRRRTRLRPLVEYEAAQLVADLARGSVWERIRGGSGNPDQNGTNAQRTPEGSGQRGV